MCTSSRWISIGAFHRSGILFLIHNFPALSREIYAQRLASSDADKILPISRKTRVESLAWAFLFAAVWETRGREDEDKRGLGVAPRSAGTLTHRDLVPDETSPSSLSSDPEFYGATTKMTSSTIIKRVIDGATRYSVVHIVRCHLINSINIAASHVDFTLHLYPPFETLTFVQVISCPRSLSIQLTEDEHRCSSFDLKFQVLLQLLNDVQPMRLMHIDSSKSGALMAFRVGIFEDVC